MRTLLPFLACVLMVLTAWIGTASAVEFVACPEMAQTMQMHACDDALVPADADKGYPHRHASCHGHHVATPAATGLPATPVALESTFRPMRRLALVGSPADQALRPPQS
jgi:hypothetical protein